MQHIERSLGEQILKERDQILEKSEINEYNTHNTTQHNTTQHNINQINEIEIKQMNCPKNKKYPFSLPNLYICIFYLFICK